MAGLRSPSEGAGLEVRLLHATALERTSPRTQRGHSAGLGHSTRGGARTNRSSDNLFGRRSLRRLGSVASATQSLLGRRFGRRLCTAHESSCSSLPVPRRTTLRGLASRRRIVVGRRGCRVAAHPGVARMRPGRLGGTRRGRAGGSTFGSGRVPEPEQEGRPWPQIRAIRAAAVGRERDAADRRRRPRQRLPNRPAAAQEAVLTEDRDARQALQTVLPDRQDPRGRRECVRVEDLKDRKKERITNGNELNVDLPGESFRSRISQGFRAVKSRRSITSAIAISTDARESFSGRESHDRYVKILVKRLE